MLVTRTAKRISIADCWFTSLAFQFAVCFVIGGPRLWLEYDPGPIRERAGELGVCELVATQDRRVAWVRNNTCGVRSGVICVPTQKIQGVHGRDQWVAAANNMQIGD